MEELATPAFYAARRRAVARHGVLVVNLWGSDRHFDDYLQRIEAAFEGQVCCVPAAAEREHHRAGLQAPARCDALGRVARARPAAGSSATAWSFAEFVEVMKRLNPHTDAPTDHMSRPVICFAANRRIDFVSWFMKESRQLNRFAGA